MEDKARDAVLALLASRVPDGSVCPSEVARAINPGPHWREAMASVHATIDRLVTEKMVRLSWKGQPLTHREGPYRISRPIKN
ncbi:DUF3253 domain-containing protein [Sphingopyxis sp. R3-92]|uniref:DUF3253 domain-containing protein n=1 Tax=Sphingopyxis sp. R3-92 TaxID=3158553 RepID=UPI003EE7A203